MKDVGQTRQASSLTILAPLNYVTVDGANRAKYGVRAQLVQLCKTTVGAIRPALCAGYRATRVYYAAHFLIPGFIVMQTVELHVNK